MGDEHNNSSPRGLFNSKALAINQGASCSTSSAHSSAENSGRSTPDANQASILVPPFADSFDAVSMDLLGLNTPIEDAYDQSWSETKLVVRYLETVGPMVKAKLKERLGLSSDEGVYKMFVEDDFNQQFQWMHHNIPDLAEMINTFVDETHRPDLVYPTRVRNKCHRLACKQMTNACSLLDRGKHIQALAMLTQVILYSPDNMDYANTFAGPANCHYRNALQHSRQSDRRPELAEAYRLRAKTLMALGSQLEAIEDLEMAMSLDHPDQVELVQLKAECSLKTGLYYQASRIKTQLEQWAQRQYRDGGRNNEGDTQKIKLTEQELTRLREALPKLSSAIDKASGGVQSDKRSSIANRDQEVLPYVRQYHPDFKPTKVDDFATMGHGLEFAWYETTRRGLSATRTMKPGEVVLVEKPLAAVLHPDHELAYCHHCLGQLLPTLPVYPCSGCALVAYCSGKCGAQDWKQYHSYECSHQALVYELGLHALPMRMMMATGLKTLYFYFMQMHNQSGNTQAPKPAWCDNIRQAHMPPIPECGWQERADGEKVLHNYELLYLDTNLHSYSLEERFNMALIACLLLEVTKRTNFFYRQLVANFDDEGVAKLSHSHLRAWDMWAGALLLRLAYISEANAQPIKYHAYDRFNALGEGCDVKRTQVGWALYITGSRLRNACAPNAIRRYIFGGTCLVQVNDRPVAKHELITVAYCARQAPFYRRRRWLAKQYRIQCDCERCCSEMDYLAAIDFHFAENGQYNEQEMWQELRGDFLSDEKVISSCNTNPTSVVKGEEQKQILKAALEQKPSGSPKDQHHLIFATADDARPRSQSALAPELPKLYDVDMTINSPETSWKERRHRRYHAHRCSKCRHAITGHGYRVTETEKVWEFVCSNYSCSHHKRAFVTEQRVCEYVKSDFVLAHANSFMTSVEQHVNTGGWVHHNRFQVVYRLLRMLKNSNLMASTLTVDIARRSVRLAVRLGRHDEADKLMNIALKHMAEAVGEVAPEYAILQFDELVTIYKRLRQPPTNAVGHERQHFLNSAKELDKRLAQLSFPHHYAGNYWHDLRMQLQEMRDVVKAIKISMFSFWHPNTKAMRAKAKRVKAAIKVPQPSQ